MANFHGFVQSLTVMGCVRSVHPEEGRFVLQTRSGDEFHLFVGPATTFRVLRNLDGLDRDRVPEPENANGQGVSHRMAKYVRTGELIAAQGVFQEEGRLRRFDARDVHLLHSDNGRYLFEDTHWWLTQIARLADEWLDDLFGDRRTYQQDDFAELYRTNLNILGLPTELDPDLQECATLSRLIYGLSSAYLLTGGERYLLAAKAGVRYQRETFRTLSHDGTHCFWAFGKRKGRYGTRIVVPSENADDRNTIPLYEQIYALAGLCQYYRITSDWQVLEDIRRTIRAFNDFYLDELSEAKPWATGSGGYFSHIDYATMRPDTEVLGENQSRKNWNSIGDHIPAYLVNLVLALDPPPLGRDDAEDIKAFIETCRRILETTSRLIVEKFPDPGDKVPYVRERFHHDWTPDPSWGWQQDRAIVGHNLKIAWNLTRVANYHLARNEPEEAESALAVAETLAQTMAEAGVDRIRGGVFDAVEREPKNGMPVDFTWSTTKDFWQQEQAILAYLILYGHTEKQEYLQLAREMAAFWNLFFLDHDNRGIFFRVTENGLPHLLGNYINKGGHSISGYHVFELNYLAHIYMRTYLNRDAENAGFCLYFRPDADSGQKTINVLPDFVRPGDLTIKGIVINGVRRPDVDTDNFRIPLGDDELGSEVIVEFEPRRGERPS
ncbi:MAG: AGE family epimerase/isomerase [Actinomycetota bacterium]|nr:AGE family epimerase/isomerase [Actinomycetota bacterium]